MLFLISSIAHRACKPSSRIDFAPCVNRGGSRRQRWPNVLAFTSLRYHVTSGGETKPNAEAITKLAKTLDTTVDYLMNGTTDDVAENAGLEKEIISRFKEVQQLPSEEKQTVLSLLDAFIAKSRIKDLLGA